jgi:hypothetical protein
MKIFRIAFFCFVATGTARLAADDFLDRVDDALTTSALGDTVRARLSGTMDLEGYRVQQPAPALIRTTGDNLFNPRLTLFLDAQLGAHLYVFAQSRVDRGYDPADEDARMRLDEWALRFTPWVDGRFNLQIGKFATAVGNWVSRHGSWDNPFISAPLPYENLTGVWDVEAVPTSGALLQWSHVRPGLPASITAEEKYLRVPIIWGPGYTNGAAVSGALGKIRYTFELKNASLSSRPDTWSDATPARWRHPTVSGRVGYRPNEMWNFGVSASEGSYLRPFAAPTLAAGHGLGDYRETVLGQDVGFAWHHLQVWAELYEARFAIPRIGDADTFACYVEAKYKFTPQFFGAVRWNQQLFGTIPDRGGRTQWGHDVSRLDLAPGYRFTPHTQFKLQYSFQHGDNGVRDNSHSLAAQLTVRF